MPASPTRREMSPPQTPPRDGAEPAEHAERIRVVGLVQAVGFRVHVRIADDAPSLARVDRIERSAAEPLPRDTAFVIA